MIPWALREPQLVRFKAKPSRANGRNPKTATTPGNAGISPIGSEVSRGENRRRRLQQVSRSLIRRYNSRLSSSLPIDFVLYGCAPSLNRLHWMRVGGNAL